MTDTLYTKKSLALLLKTTRETLSLYLNTGRLKDLVQIIDQKHNRVTLKLTVPFEKFNEVYQAEKIFQVKNAVYTAQQKTQERREKEVVLKQ